MFSLKELIVYQKAYDMTQYGYTALRQFPRSEKHTWLGKECFEYADMAYTGWGSSIGSLIGMIRW
jgi:hypothetical protein